MSRYGAVASGLIYGAHRADSGDCWLFQSGEYGRKRWRGSQRQERDHRGSVTRRGLVLRYRRASYHGRITFGQLAFGVEPPTDVIFNIDIPRPGQPDIENFAFIEPDDPTLVNWISTFSGELVILSDLPSSLLPNDNHTLFVSDGTTVGGIGFDRNNFMGITLTFHDAASREPPLLPDRGSTLSLFAAALIALFFARRRSAVRAG
jgi:hypothetical protein